MVDIEKRRADRLRVMKAIFEASRGSETSVVSGDQLMLDVGLSGRDLADACKYLQGEGLITATYERPKPPSPDPGGATSRVHVRGLSRLPLPLPPSVAGSSFHRTPYETPYEMHITHRGIKEMEQSLKAPSEATRHFPPAVSIINIQGSVYGSAIQSGSHGARQEATFGDLNLEGATFSGLNLEEVREFLREFDAKSASLDLLAPAAKELAAKIETVKEQVQSSEPERHIIGACLVSIRVILETTAGGVAASELLGLLQHLHL